jgi:hypothetical protein
MLKNRFHTPFALAAGCVVASGLGAACGETENSRPTSGQSGWTYLPPGADVGGSAYGGTGVGGTAGGSKQGGAGGVGGTAPIVPKPFDCEGKEPNQPLITSFDEFMKDRWSSPGNIDGGIYIYPDPLMVSDGEFLRFDALVDTYAGMGIWFAGCLDASRFSGVRFTAYGDVGWSTKVQFYAIANRNRDIDVVNNVGACAPDDPQNPWQTCRPPGVTLTIGPEPTTFTVPWTAFKGGLPTATTDGSDILAFQWSFEWSEGVIPFAAKLTIDDLKFVAAGDGAGGAGGSANGDEPSVGGAGGTEDAGGAGGSSQ